MKRGVVRRLRCRVCIVAFVELAADDWPLMLPMVADCSAILTWRCTGDGIPEHCFLPRLRLVIAAWYHIVTTVNLCVFFFFFFLLT